VNVDIDTDAGLPVAHGDDQVGGFAAHAGQLQQPVHSGGDLPLVLIEQNVGNIQNILGFGAVKAHRVDGLFDFGGGALHHLLWRVSQIKQAGGNLGGEAVFGAQAQNGGDENLVRPPTPAALVVNQRRGPLLGGAADGGNYLMNITVVYHKCFGPGYNWDGKAHLTQNIFYYSTTRRQI
jgi:hypothetical protein